MEYNATYNELSVTPISNDQTYSRLRMTHNKVRPSDDLTRRADINQNTTRGMKQTSTKKASSNTTVTTAVIITVIADINADFNCTVCGNHQSINI